MSTGSITAYEGDYFSEETNSDLTIRNDSSKLMIRLNADKKFKLVPVFKDEFHADALECDLQFVRDNKGAVSGIKFYFSRTRGVEFKKHK